MANFYGNARSNYFEVKDTEAFEKEMATLPDITVIYQGDLVGVMVDSGDSGCFPSWKYDLEDNTNMEEEEIDIVEIVAGHLAVGAVAIFLQVGSEKMRYIDGWAEAINSKYDRKTISLTDIYDVAAGLTTSMKAITRAEY